MIGFFNDEESLFESSHTLYDSFTKKCPSYEQFLPFTELTVNLANEAIERDLGRLDMFTASDFLSKRDVSPEVMVTALMYVSRYKRRKDSGEYRPMLKSSFTSADLFLVSMMLASKYLFDDGVEENVINEEWADDFGIETEEINALEVDFLNNVDWRLHVTVNEYKSLKNMIGKSVANYLWMSHCENGSTYSELAKLSHDTANQVREMVKLICKVIIGCTVIYIGVIVSVHLLVLCPSNANYNHQHHHVMHTFSPTYTPTLVSTTMHTNHNSSTQSPVIFKEINDSHNHHATNPQFNVKHIKILQYVL